MPRVILFVALLAAAVFAVRALIRAFNRLDRERRWVLKRDGAANEARTNPMSRAEALEALGLEEGASKEQILRAYRTLIRKVHPDTPGGSAYLATKLNQAKDALLG